MSVLWTHKAHFRIYKETPLVPIIYHTKEARIFDPAFFRYISILTEHLRPGLPRVSFPSFYRRQPYLLHSNKLHLLGNIHYNVRLGFLRSVSALTEASSGKKFKAHGYVYFFINECNSYSCIPSCTRYCGTRHGLASSSVILVHSEHPLMKAHTHTGFHLHSLVLYLLNDGSIRAETCRKKDDLTQKGILANKHILMKRNSEVKYTEDTKY